MSVLVIDYSDLNNSVKKAGKVSEECVDYGERINKYVCKKMESLPGSYGRQGQYAVDMAKNKIDELKKKGERFEQYGKNLSEFSNLVRETDERVQGSLLVLGAEFRVDHDMMTGFDREVFVRFAIGFVNTSDIGRWLKDQYNTLSNGLTNIADTVKYWYECQGGKYWVDIAKSFRNIGFEIAMIILDVGITIVSGGTLTPATIAGIVNSIISIENEIYNIVNSGRAIWVNSGHPAVAQRYSEMDTIADTFNSITTDNVWLNKSLYVIADIVDGLDIGTGLISLGGSIKSLKQITKLSELTKLENIKDILHIDYGDLSNIKDIDTYKDLIKTKKIIEFADNSIDSIEKIIQGDFTGFLSDDVQKVIDTLRDKRLQIPWKNIEEINLITIPQIPGNPIKITDFKNIQTIDMTTIPQIPGNPIKITDFNNIQTIDITTIPQIPGNPQSIKESIYGDGLKHISTVFDVPKFDFKPRPGALRSPIFKEFGTYDFDFNFLF